MDSESSPVCVLNTINSIPNVVISQGVQNKQATPNQLMYFINVEDIDGTQVLQIPGEPVTDLGFCLYNPPESNSQETVKCAKINNVPKQLKNIKPTNSQISNNCLSRTTKPLGSSENPIEIINDGQMLHSTQNISADHLQQIAEALRNETTQNNSLQEECQNGDIGENVVYRVMYPDELDLRPLQTKRGRPKKRLKDDQQNESKSEERPVKNMRTRSGRITRPPKHIRKDFSKIQTSNTYNNEGDIKVVEFEPLTTNQPSTDDTVPVVHEILTTPKRKRLISSQHRCPICQKAYLGQNRMLMHLQKHPDHGPIPDISKPKENDTWNYLIDMANTNPVGKRGIKFCKQLMAIIENVQIVAKLLFKRSSRTEKNFYFIDSILSKILGIESGNYVINESQLQKDVNILRYITEDIISHKDIEKEPTSKFDLHAYVEKNPLDSEHKNEIKLLRKNEDLPLTESHINNLPEKRALSFCEVQNENTNIDDTSNKLENLNFHQELEFGTPSNFSSEDQRKLMDPTLNIIASCNNQSNSNNEHSLQNDLLSDNFLLNTLPTLRTSVDELILNNVDTTQVTNLLDNSTSSDELMNVDQFVNERFKNFTEPDIELPNPPLSLDLPLDLFQFHSS